MRTHHDHKLINSIHSTELVQLLRHLSTRRRSSATFQTASNLLEPPLPPPFPVVQHLPELVKAPLPPTWISHDHYLQLPASPTVSFHLLSKYHPTTAAAGQARHRRSPKWSLRVLPLRSTLHALRTNVPRHPPLLPQLLLRKIARSSRPKMTRGKTTLPQLHPQPQCNR